MPTVPHRASVRLTDEIDTQLRRQGRRARAELADIAVLSKDILAILEKEIHTAKVFYTIARGRVRYRR